MSNMTITSNANAYGWRCADLVAVEITTTFVDGSKHGVKHAAPAKARLALRAWDGPTT